MTVPPRRRAPRPVLTLAPLAASALVLGACSGPASTSSGDDDRDVSSFSRLSPADTVAAAKDAMRDIRSLRITGTMTNQDDEMDVDLALADDGDCRGTLGLKGGVAEVVATDGETWMRPDPVVWSAFAGEDADQVASYVADRWVVAGDTELASLCDFDQVVGALLAPPEEGRRYDDAGRGEVDGESVYVVESSGPAGTSFGSVAADDPHLILRTERREGPSPATVTFTDFDVPVSAERPAPEDVVDLPEGVDGDAPGG